MRGWVTEGQMGPTRGAQTMPAPRKYPKTAELGGRCCQADLVFCGKRRSQQRGTW